MSTPAPSSITCPMCGQRFNEQDSAACCANCSLFGAGGCHLLRCPHCGYEMPPPARLPKLLAKLGKRIAGKKDE